MTILEDKIANVNINYDTLNAMLGDSRARRSMMQNIKSIFRVIFGNFEYEDAVQYDQAIHNISARERETIKLIKSQTSIVRSTISNFNTTVTNINKNQELFNSII